jgi:CheY-like chemotaxis protein
MANVKRILIADDESGVIFMLEESLRLLTTDAIIDVAHNDSEAVAALESQEYDLIICDHFLGGSTTGLEIWLRYRERMGEAFFVLMSGSPYEMVFAALPRATAPPAFVTKPFGLERLRLLLRKMRACEEEE